MCKKNKKFFDGTLSASRYFNYVIATVRMSICCPFKLLSFFCKKYIPIFYAI